MCNIFSGLTSQSIIKGLLSLLVLSMLCALMPLNLTGQFEPNSAIISDIITIPDKILAKKEITAELKLTGSVDKEKKVIIQLIPTFKEEVKPDKKEGKREVKILDARTIGKYKLSYELNPSKIFISPPNYCSLKKQGNEIISFTGPVALEFQLANNVTYNSNLVYNFIFQLVQGKDKTETVAKLELLLTKEIAEPTETKQTNDSGVENTNQITGKEKKKTDINKDAAKGGGGGKDDKAKADSTAKAIALPLNRMLEDCKALHSKVWEINETFDEKPVTQSQIDTYKTQLTGYKQTFDMRMAMVNPQEAPDVDFINKLFQDYFTKTLTMLNDLTAKIANGGNNELNEKENQIEKSEKQNKVLQTVLIILGFILLVFIIWVLMIYIQKKIKLNFQKKMKRKATMELNKQKFQATRQQNKLKI